MWSQQGPSNSYEITLNTHSLPVSLSGNVRGTIFGEPTEIGRYAVDGEREIVFEPFPLRYLAMPSSESVSLDLNLGYERAVKYLGRNVNERIENLLKWILKNQETTFLDYGRYRPDFICIRGVLKYVMCTPFLTSRFVDWIIYATKHRGTIYMVASDSAKEQLRRDDVTEMDELMSFWGYKFEQYLTSDQPHGTPNTRDPVNENNEFYSVIRRQIGGHSVVFAAEIDAIDPNYLDGNPGSTTKSYVELKTTKQVETTFELMKLQRHKHLLWWAQSYLADVPKIAVGYRDPKGVVRKVKTYKTEELPRTAVTNDYWSAPVCKSFCESFLSFVKQSVKEDNPRVVYKFHWAPDKDVTCVRLANPGIHQVLPDWYFASV